MKKALQMLLLLSLCAGGSGLLLPCTGAAFDTVSLGGDKEITVWGYLRNSTGMFTQNPNPWGPTAGQSGNQLAIERTWFRTNVDLKLSNEFRFFGVGQFAYEPWLPVEQGALVQKNGNEYTDKNINDLMREAYIEWKPNKTNNIKVGKMNVVWGETITGRVGDVVNPADIRWATPFSREATDDMRIPQFMVRGIHDFDSISSSFEWIVSPTYTSPEWSVSRAPMAANLFLNQAGARFAMAPETRFLAPNSLGNPALAGLGVPQLIPYGDPNVVSASPFNSSWNHSPFNPGNGWSPTLVQPNLITGNTRLTSEIPDVRVKYPNGIQDTRFGFRTASTFGGYNFGLIYFHRQVYEPVTRREGIINSSSITFPTGPGTTQTVVNNTRRYTVEYPDIDNIGFYVNKQLPWPGVIRAEMIYTPNMPYNYFIPTQASTVNTGLFTVPITTFADESGVVKRDNFKYLFAYDLTGFLFFDWHKTAPFDVTFEHVGDWTPNARDLQYYGPGVNYATKLPSWQGNFNLDIKTNWFYNNLETGLTAGYGTFGNSILLVPRVKWMPGWWDKKFSAELRYIYVDADSRYEGLGVWKDKNYVLLQTQFNF